MTDRILTNDDGSLDEIVVDDCVAHLEQLDDDHWYFGMTREGQVAVQVWLYRKGDRIEASFEVYPADAIEGGSHEPS